MPNILITGASGGLGSALARAYAAPHVSLALWGRDAERLDAVTAECRQRGAAAEALRIDLRDIDLLISRIEELDARMPLDLAIFNAGVGGITPPEQPAERPQRTHEIATINFTSPVVGAAAVGELMAKRRRGQIVLIGSVAGAFPLPMAPTYAGAKAGMAIFAEALNLRLARYGVIVTLVAPAFIDTPMSRGVGGPQPFLMTAEAAAATIQRKLARRSAEIMMPWQYAVARTVSRFLPRTVTRAVLRRL